MNRSGSAVVIVLGACVLASASLSAQRISVDAVKNGHFPAALRGHLDARPDKSHHGLSLAGNHHAVIAAAKNAKSGAPPKPIVSSFFRTSSRSNSVNYGFVVGPDPFSGNNGSKSDSVKTFIVPLVIKVHQVATDFAVDANNNLILAGIKDQDATYDPTTPAPACLGPKNNVPFTLAVQSPVYQDQHWVWGGTDIGDGQYVEAFQRANFWSATGEAPGRHGIHLATQVLPPLVIDFPKGSGIGLPQSSSLLGYSTCAPSVMVDFTLFDEYLDFIAIPHMSTAYGVNAGNFPMFIAGNVLWGAVVGQLPLFEPEAAGYHSFSSVDPAQTYGVTQFGDESVFTWPDAVPLSHEVGEWMNDPTGSNYVQLYNATAATDPTAPAECQENYEVGDILAGFFMPPVTSKNGYTYTVQELAFFSYFYGGPSFAVNGWFSNNGTLTTDAGAACSPF